MFSLQGNNIQKLFLMFYVTGQVDEILIFRAKLLMLTKIMVQFPHQAMTVIVSAIINPTNVVQMNLVKKSMSI